MISKTWFCAFTNLGYYDWNAFLRCTLAPLAHPWHVFSHVSKLRAIFAKMRTVFTASRCQNSPWALTPFTSVVSRNRLHLAEPNISRSQSFHSETKEVNPCPKQYETIETIIPLYVMYTVNVCVYIYIYSNYFRYSICKWTMHQWPDGIQNETTYVKNMSLPAQTALAQDQPLCHDNTCSIQVLIVRATAIRLFDNSMWMMTLFQLCMFQSLCSMFFWDM